MALCWSREGDEREDAWRQLDDAEPDLTATLRSIWARPVAQSSFCKDFPRLARRITIRTRKGSLRAPSDDKPTTAEDTFRLISGIVQEVVQDLEPTIASSVRLGMSAIAARVTSKTDLQMVMPEVVELLGPESKALKALRLVEQSVVLVAVTHMRRTVTQEIFTKDMRTPDGWQIEFDLFDRIQVAHRRREESVDLLGEPSQHFELGFELRATWDRDMGDLHAASLRVVDLKCAENMSPARRIELESRIPGGMIVM